MGWWSKEIMGGDEPLDQQDNLKDILGIYDEPKKKDIEANIDALVECVRSKENNPYYDSKVIAYQVLALMIMKAGAKMSDELKQELLDEAGEDSWAENDEERALHVYYLLNLIREYDGTPIRYTSKGLMAVVAERLSEDNNKKLKNNC